MPPPRQYRNIDDLPRVIPIFPLSRALLLPAVQMPLNIFEGRYLNMVNDAISGARMIGMIQPDQELDDDVDIDPSAKPELYQIGCVGRIVSFNETSDNRILLSLLGIARFQIVKELSVTTKYRQVVADFTPFTDDLSREGESKKVDRVGLMEAVKAYCGRAKIQLNWKSINQTPDELLVNSFSMMAPYRTKEKQALLEAPTLEERNQILTTLTKMALAELSGSKSTPLQ